MSQSIIAQDAQITPSSQSTAAEATLYQRLDKYLDSALEILSSWGDWLAEHERSVLDNNVSALANHATAAADLHAELTALSQRRSELLASARSAGYICSTLKEFAQLLPQWHSQPSFRGRVLSVQHSLSNLRRLNTAAWMLVNQCSRVVDETLLLMTSGSTISGAYIDTPHADLRGGHILDTEA